MKKYTLLGHLFELDDRAALFLERYVERIEEYSQKQHVSNDILDDIKYSIVEKLYRFQTPIGEKDVMSIANQLGEPEDIFEEGGNNNTSSDIEKKENKFTSFIGRDRPIIWGVCYWISKTTTIPVTFVRIAFILLVFVYGVSIWTYPVLALFVPYKDKKQTTGKFGNGFFEFIRIVLWLFVLGALGGLLVGAISLMGFVTLTPAMGNQSLGPWIPTHMYLVGAFVILALIVLFIGALGGLFKKTFITKNWALLSTIVLIAGGLITAGTLYRKALGFEQIPETTVITTSTLSGIQLLSGNASGNILTLNIQGDYNTMRFPFLDDYNKFAVIDILPSQDNDIHIKDEVAMRAPTQEQLEKNTKLLNPLVISNSGNNVDISIPRVYFTQVVPRAFTNRYVTVYIPKHITFAINSKAVRRKGNINNLSYMQEKTENNIKYIGYCDENSTYSYDIKGSKYMCNLMKRYKQESELESEGYYNEARYIPHEEIQYQAETTGSISGQVQ